MSVDYQDEIPFVNPAPIDEAETKKQKKQKDGSKKWVAAKKNDLFDILFLKMKRKRDMFQLNSIDVSNNDANFLNNTKIVPFYKENLICSCFFTSEKIRKSTFQTKNSVKNIIFLLSSSSFSTSRRKISYHFIIFD